MVSVEKYNKPIRTIDDIDRTTKRTHEYKQFRGDPKVSNDYRTQSVCGWCKRLLEIEHHGNDYRIADAIDHCHDTGKYRGRICQRCNVIEGKARKINCYMVDGYWYPIIFHEYVSYVLSKVPLATREEIEMYICTPHERNVPMDTRTD